VVVVYLRRVPCPRAEGGAYNSIGRGVRACNTFWALWRSEGFKAPVQSFPGSTFPAGAQGMVLEAMVDLNVLSCSVPIIMRERGRSCQVRRNLSLDIERGEVRPRSSSEVESSPYPLGETEPAPRGSGKAESIPQPSGEARLARKASGEAETSP